MIARVFFGFFLLSFVASCGSNSSKTIVEKPTELVIDVPAFDGDSAYNFVSQQVRIGPRVPGSAEHIAGGDQIVSRLKSFGATVVEQKFKASTYDGVELELRNIIGSMYPERKKRILLAAHWDTRPFSDKDPEKPNGSFQGANDGASGVGVLLEIARQLSLHAPPTVGIDLIFFDGEDWGERIDEGRVKPAEGFDSWWCLGSQYWSKNKHSPNYSAYYGILLDMVGAYGSQFHKEGYSVQMAPRIVSKVWDRASKLGYSGIFVNKTQGGITDDHEFVNKVAKIPMINIVHFDPEHGYFGDYHHTQKDNMDIIDPKILEIVGTTVLNVLFYEK